MTVVALIFLASDLLVSAQLIQPRANSRLISLHHQPTCTQQHPLGPRAHVPISGPHFHELSSNGAETRQFQLQHECAQTRRCDRRGAHHRSNPEGRVLEGQRAVSDKLKQPCRSHRASRNSSLQHHPIADQRLVVCVAVNGFQLGARHPCVQPQTRLEHSAEAKQRNLWIGSCRGRG